ncbi:hypothetical protein [Bradyrhizobium symbiodeficiens]|uniref:hypothetical protein n=1 Tax=Bradyrhizobium symbiodeficiens TaxID=1404367 RepID=UPI002FE5F931
MIVLSKSALRGWTRVRTTSRKRPSSSRWPTIGDDEVIETGQYDPAKALGSSSRKQMETAMSQQSSMHFYLNWAKERIDEMDAALASFEVKAGQAKAESKVKTDRLLSDLTTRRDAFQAMLKTQAEAGEAAWTEAKADLEKQWAGFEAQVKTYFEGAGKQFEQQQATFKDVAAAQAKAWREAADKFRDAAGKVASARTVDVDAALKQMKSDASEAEARLQKLKQAGSESWSVLSAALAESRKAFDQANQAAWDALKGAGPKS